MTKVTNILFLDIDGVLNHQFSKDREYTQSERFGLAQDLVDNLKNIIDSVDNVKIVISSSWRSFKVHEDVHEKINWRCILEHMLGGKQGVIWGDLGKYNEIDRALGAKGRAEDIKMWLNAYRKQMNVSNFVILDDECSELRKVFPNNVIDCEIATQKGLTEAKANEAIWILNNFGRDKKMTPNTWFVSDTHFCHGNIIKYCNRPWSSGRDNDGNMIVTQEDIDRMDKDLILRWNSVVKSDDIVWHLGDFALGNKDNVKRILSQLNGKVNLVMGNHDHNKLKFYEEAGFHRVYDRPVIINKFVILSHAPLEFLNENTPFFGIFGHVHDSDHYKTFSKSGCCVCVERHNYTPVSWEKIQEEYEKLNRCISSF